MTVPVQPLIPDVHKSLNSTTHDNLIIHGDNLHALKALLPRYAGKVNCIYIDPPYNTGNEGWVYNDNVNSDMMRRWLDNAKEVDGEDLERHDKWLCMMWPRLQLLKELLSEDGVIFVSIDDNEQHRLRMMMDEVFGESNFIANMVRENKRGSGHDSKFLAVEYDYVIVFGKNVGNLTFHKKPADTDTQSKYNREDRHIQTRGRYKRRDMDYKGSYSRSLDYPITLPSGDIIYAGGKFGEPNTWRWSKEKFEWGVKSNFIVFDDIKKKVYLKEYQYVNNQNVAYNRTTPYRGLVKFLNGDGTSQVEGLFGRAVFHFPKPVELIKYILRSVTNQNDIVLDSFAGSGTTAHAVLDLNKQDGGNRKFILVECEDYADTVTAERVRRVIKGIPESKIEGTGGSFTYYTLGDTLDINKILVGKDLPDYSVLASHLLYTATGISISKKLEPKNRDGLFHTIHGTDYYLLYRPDIEYMRSNKVVLDGEMVERIHRRGKKAVVFGGAKYMGQNELTQYNIEFCSIPELLRR